MARLTSIEPGFYRIPLPTVLTDSTHGEMKAFELNTVRLRDADGAEGTGYTFTVGRNGGAVDSVLTREMTELMAGEDADTIERLWLKAWWALHYGGRGGPTVLALSAFDMALWDLKARRANLPLWRLLGGFDPRVPCYAGGIDLDLPRRLAAPDRRQPRQGLPRDQDEGRPQELVRGRRARRRHAPASRPRLPLMVDANMKWGVDEAIRAARALQPFDLTWLEEPTIPDDPAGHARIVREGGLP